MSLPKKIAVLDYETDPFKYGRVPEPFACEFYSDDHCHVTWGPNCVSDMMLWLEALPCAYIIYAHNGGKFDVHMHIEHIDNPVRIVKSRIVSCKLYQHTFRDSYAIIPVPLKMMAPKGQGKKEIDYAKMERGIREEPRIKAEILDYLHADCTTLHSKVVAFVERFGTKLTVGSTAMGEIRKRHEFKTMDKRDDRYFRQFYYGGRVQCFRSGILKGPFSVYDLNSAYPDTMRNRRHPVNQSFAYGRKLPDTFERPYFAIIEGSNRGALPGKSDDGGLSFTRSRGTFAVCSHELETALKYGLFEIERVIECAVASEWISFEQFVDDFYSEKVASKLSGDFDSEMFSKFMLNSGYGKFGTNPDNFQDFLLVREFGKDRELREQGYELTFDGDDFEIWAKRSDRADESYFDVSIAASITSGTRATLLDGLQHAVDPIYCDTDSIICREFHGRIDAATLGAWKFEKRGDMLAVAGKKMYGLWDEAEPDKPLKLASKGGTLTLAQLRAICAGETVHYENDAPTFSYRRETKFVHRNFRMTVANA